MEVILREDVSSLGKAGEVVKVRDGYGRNFLLPQNKAIVADSSNLKRLEAQKKMIETRRAKSKVEAEKIAGRLNGIEVTIARKVGAQDRLFGAVTKGDIVQALQKQGVQIDKHLIELESAIKTIGVFDLAVSVHPEIKANFKLWVVREE